MRIKDEMRISLVGYEAVEGDKEKIEALLIGMADQVIAIVDEDVVEVIGIPGAAGDLRME